MGCLLLPFELIFDLIIEGWLSLMLWILPKKTFSIGLYIVLNILVAVYSAILLVMFVIGILAAVTTEATVFDLWKLIFLPLGLSVTQIVFGIVVRCIVKKRDSI